MTIEDQSEGSHPSIVVQGGIGISGQTIVGGGHVPKIRKPYTITKQRERWTEEEHGKFLEALKLYGRAWRKIEEHVGTKTAVQIRSHAQKFFSKVVRESNSGNLNSIKTIEIPPPRPKKKPMHPYPRKLALPNKGEMMVSLKDRPGRSISPNSSVDREHQSPTSVISAVVSDTSGSADSSSAPDGSSSPISCLPPQEDANMQENLSQSDEPVSLKLELFPKIDTSAREGSVEATSSKSLKLFGRTVMVKDDDCPELSADKREPEEGSGSLVGEMPYPLGQQEVADIPVVNSQSLVGTDPCEVLPAIGYASADPSNMWTSYGGLPYPIVPFDNQLTRSRCSPVDGDVLERDIKKEVSCTGSESESVNPSRGSWEAETQSSTLRSSISNGGNMELKRARTDNNKQMRGFVPYKRWCLSAGKSQSFTINSGDDKEGQRSSSWLCL